MAKLAETKAENPRVKAFAQKTRADQEKEIAALRGHREHWFAGQPQRESMRMPGMSKTEMSKKMESQMSDLQGTAGHGFDHMFIDMTAGRHKEAIMMAKDALGKATHAELKSFSRSLNC